ncbi:saccharopine dehydrogenase-like oxidoreductase [Musca vetustissima]|uniref:saccharopine dehydrogenase-like oxidoreductase n=1 Tax=Musca vetustissima TaxID=27455 RepID=UPI002AB71CBE|nr:saccharopine dehydrogenase-like oxidoreductase [Musca vetustissima]
MSGEKLDAIIFGATGFTGQIVVEDAIEIFKDLKWGIAGRNEKKLKELLEKIGKRTNTDLSQIPVVVADVGDEKSIENMAKNCKIVLNCCGPYHLYGEIVVKACVEAGTHHVDLSGEPQYISAMQLKYHELAQSSGSYVISNCAFESIPAELGVLYAEENFPGIVNSVELYCMVVPNYVDTTSKAILNSGTWDSAIVSMQYARQMWQLEGKLNKEPLPRLRPKLWMKIYPHKIEGASKYFAPFPITDTPVVERSQRLFYVHENKRPMQFQMYIGFTSFFLAMMFPLFLLFIALMAQCGCTRSLLFKYPHFFTRGTMTHQGPTEANRKVAEFIYILKAKGWTRGTADSEAPNKEVVVRVSGKDPCYGITSTCLLMCAKVILKQHQQMPGNGGVFPPGFAFAKTQLLEELGGYKSGLKFEVLKP